MCMENGEKKSEEAKTPETLEVHLSVRTTRFKLMAPIRVAYGATLKDKWEKHDDKFKNTANNSKINNHKTQWQISFFKLLLFFKFAVVFLICHCVF